jgi:hypothetical protein
MIFITIGRYWANRFSLVYFFRLLYIVRRGGERPGISLPDYQSRRKGLAQTITLFNMHSTLLSFGGIDKIEGTG